MFTEISLEMIVGRLDPYVVAKNTLTQREITPSIVRDLNIAINESLKTGVFVSNDFNCPIALFGGNNIMKYAERLAQYNYHLATLISTDKDFLADVAFTLFQLKKKTIVYFEERQKLFREFYPFLIARDLKPEVIFYIQFLAVEHYMLLAEKDKNYFNEVIAYGSKVVQFSNESFARGTIQLCKTLYWLGIACNEIGKDKEDLLKKSIVFLEQCINIKEHCRGTFLGSVLNSLGYSCLLLGKLKNDKEILEKAVSSLQSGLPYRHDERQKLLTETNLKIARQLLSETHQTIDESKYSHLLYTIDFVGRRFEEVAMDTDGNAQDRTTIIQSGMDELCTISRTVYAKDDPYLQARFELIMGLGLLFNGDNLLAICYLNASRRKWDTMDGHAYLPRKTSAYYNLGLAFAKMEGLYSKTAYIKTAIEKLSYAKSLFNELGSPERVQVCDLIIEDLKTKQSEL